MVQMGTAGHEQARPIRQRLSPSRVRDMARRSADRQGFTLSPGARRVAGWLAALLLVLGIAVVVRVVGGDGEGIPVADPSGSAGPVGDAAPIAFGTAIDQATGQVAEASATNRFSPDDTFAYSVAPQEPVPPEVYVEVRRTQGGPEGVVQAPVDGQALPDPRAIAFTVPADNLFEVFGPGTYLMLIYADPQASAPVAEGTFELAATDASSTPSPSPAP